MSAEGQKDITTPPADDSASASATPPSDGASPPGDPAPSADPQGAAPDAGGGDAGTVDPASPPEGGEGGEAAAAAEKPDWRDKRIAKLTARLKQAAPAPSAPQPDPATPPALDENEVNRRAAALADQREFDRRCGEIAAAGKAQFPDFPDRIANLRNAFAFDQSPEDEAGWATVVAAAMESGDAAARVIYEIAGNPEEADRLIELGKNPRAAVRLGMEIAKMAEKKSEAAPSAAPKPIAPIGNKGKQNTEIDPTDKNRADNLSTREWINRRQKQQDEKRRAGARDVW